MSGADKPKFMTGAYSFICSYSSTDALCLRLNQVAWQWCVGDSYWYGDYVAAVPFPGVRNSYCRFSRTHGNRVSLRIRHPHSQRIAPRRGRKSTRHTVKFWHRFPRITSGRLSGLIEPLRLSGLLDRFRGCLSILRRRHVTASAANFRYPLPVRIVRREQSSNFFFHVIHNAPGGRLPLSIMR